MCFRFGLFFLNSIIFEKKYSRRLYEKNKPKEAVRITEKVTPGCAKINEMFFLKITAPIRTRAKTAKKYKTPREILNGMNPNLKPLNISSKTGLSASSFADLNEISSFRVSITILFEHSEQKKCTFLFTTELSGIE